VFKNIPHKYVFQRFSVILPLINRRRLLKKKNLLPAPKKAPVPVEAPVEKEKEGLIILRKKVPVNQLPTGGRPPIIKRKR
jgi:hypothetical protein